MRLNAVYKLVYNRKNVKLSESDTSLIQVKVLSVDGLVKYIGTGISVKSNQWDPKNRMIVNHENAAQYNKRIHDFISGLQTRELEIIETGRMMDVADIDKYTKKPGKNSKSFIDFANAEKEYLNLSSGAKYLHTRTIKNLKACGIEKFYDLTYPNIVAFDRHLKTFLKAQVSVAKQHSVIKQYITLAQKNGHIPKGKSPYNEFLVEKGKSKIRVRLDDSEIEKMEKADLEDPLHILSRDLYMFQVYTGLAYKDLQNLHPGMIRHNDDGDWIEGLRKKNGELYTVYLIDQAMQLLKKYGGQFIPPVQQKQNELLKIVAVAAKINKNLTTHTARHSAASWMLRKGIAVAVIQQILGHQDIDTTMIYAKLERKTIMDEMKKLSK